MPTPGDVVLVPFVGVEGTKPRPAVVVSSDVYHACRRDVVVALLTSQVAKATLPTDYVLQDWAVAKLKMASAYRSFFRTYPVTEVFGQIGVLSARDWAEVQARLRLALAV